MVIRHNNSRNKNKNKKPILCNSNSHETDLCQRISEIIYEALIANQMVICIGCSTHSLPHKKIYPEKQMKMELSDELRTGERSTEIVQHRQPKVLPINENGLFPEGPRKQTPPNFSKFSSQFLDDLNIKVSCLFWRKSLISIHLQLHWPPLRKLVTLILEKKMEFFFFCLIPKN